MVLIKITVKIVKNTESKSITLTQTFTKTYPFLFKMNLYYWIWLGFINRTKFNLCICDQWVIMNKSATIITSWNTVAFKVLTPITVMCSILPVWCLQYAQIKPEEASTQHCHPCPNSDKLMHYLLMKTRRHIALYNLFYTGRKEKWMFQNNSEKHNFGSDIQNIHKQESSSLIRFKTLSLISQEFITSSLKM